jgi:chemotaxis protein MotB
MTETTDHSLLRRLLLEALPFDRLQSHIDMTVTNEGLRIALTESATGTFFDSGGTKISGDGGKLLILRAHELGKLPNHIAIEGHTDSKPYPPGATYTNWELSAGPANAGRRLMQENGIAEGPITQVRGFADQRLRKPNAPKNFRSQRRRPC